jgi:hypothetical protein
MQISYFHSFIHHTYISKIIYTKLRAIQTCAWPDCVQSNFCKNRIARHVAVAVAVAVALAVDVVVLW